MLYVFFLIISILYLVLKKKKKKYKLIFPKSNIKCKCDV